MVSRLDENGKSGKHGDPNNIYAPLSFTIMAWGPSDIYMAIRMYVYIYIYIYMYIYCCFSRQISNASGAPYIYMYSERERELEDRKHPHHRTSFSLSWP